MRSPASRPDRGRADVGDDDVEGPVELGHVASSTSTKPATPFDAALTRVRHDRLGVDVDRDDVRRPERAAAIDTVPEPQPTSSNDAGSGSATGAPADAQTVVGWAPWPQARRDR